MTRLAILVLLAALTTSFADDRWYEYKDCEHIEAEYYDGDSFHVKTKSSQYIFRLYFVDAPETDKLIPERVKEQAEYWGVPEGRVAEIAAEARDFTRKFLADGFTVFSKRKNARGRSKKERYFGMIKVGDKYLCEALVENGYARVYGAWSDLPGGMNSWKFRTHLKSIESKAKKAGKGAWSKKRQKITSVDAFILTRNAVVLSFASEKR